MLPGGCSGAHHEQHALFITHNSSNIVPKPFQHQTPKCNAPPRPDPGSPVDSPGSRPPPAPKGLPPPLLKLPPVVASGSMASCERCCHCDEARRGAAARTHVTPTTRNTKPGAIPRERIPGYDTYIRNRGRGFRLAPAVRAQTTIRHKSRTRAVWEKLASPGGRQGQEGDAPCPPARRMIRLPSGSVHSGRRPRRCAHAHGLRRRGSH